MLVFILAIAGMSETATPPLNDIVVIGERLKKLRFSAKVDKQGRVRCRITRSSGQPALDAILCPAVQDCATRAISTAEEAEACVRERLEARAAELAAAERSRGKDAVQ